MEHPVCETCPYWDSDDGEMGECLRHAPIAVVMPIRADTPDEVNDLRYRGYMNSDSPTWPQLSAEMWCGDHPDFPKWIAFRKSQPANATIQV